MVIANMKKNKKKILFLHPHIHSVNALKDFLYLDNSRLSDEFELCWDEETPDFVIVCVETILDTQLWERFKTLQKVDDSPVSIFYATEAVSPDMNLFDYAFVFDRTLSDGDRVTRIPTLLHFRREIGGNLNKRDVPKYEDKKRFCNFIYSNSNAHPARDRLFHTVSDYRFVDSMGRHLNNMGNVPSRQDEDWAKLSVEQRLPYRFSIAAENECFPGYISEKMINCYLAGTVPIYWGDPTIKEEFNERAFICTQDYNDSEQLISRIREVNESKDEWNGIVNQPIQTKEQEQRTKKETAVYYETLNCILSRDKESARRIPRGYFVDMYRELFYSICETKEKS